MSLKSEIEFCKKVLNLLDSCKTSTIFAPPLILTSLAMVLSGSEGITTEEIENVVGEGKSHDEIFQYYSDFINYCKFLNDKNEEEMKNESSEFSKTCYKLLLSYKLFFSNIPLNPNFKNIMCETFNNQMEQVNFNNSEETANKINKFVRENTEENIKKIVETSDIKKDMHLFIVNALCFKGFWIQPFEAPKLQNFYSNNNDSVREIEMITQEATCERWNLTKGDGWECLGIPYETRQSWLHILLPNKNCKIEDLIKKLDYDFVLKCVEEKSVHKIRATIPTFHIESDLNLEDILKQLGITNAFRGGHGIKLMSEKSLVIGKAIHKAGIKIDQYGTYGYAAGGFGFELQTCMEPTIFIADRPFIFFVTLVTEENPSKLKSILMMGTFC